jgi:hypothetical protein
MTMIQRLQRFAAFITGAGLWVAISFLFSGYGNYKVHPTINDEMVGRFFDNMSNGVFTSQGISFYMYSVFDTITWNGKNFSYTGVSEEPFGTL